MRKNCDLNNGGASADFKRKKPAIMGIAGIRLRCFIFRQIPPSSFFDTWLEMQ